MLNDITSNSGRTFFVRFKLHGPIAGLTRRHDGLRLEAKTGNRVNKQMKDE